MLACLYLGYIIIMAKLNPSLMPPLPENEKRVPLTPFAQAQAPRGRHALAGSWRAFTEGDRRRALGPLVVSLLPALFVVALLGLTYGAATAPKPPEATGLVELGGLAEVAGGEGAQSEGLVGAIQPEEEEKEQEQEAPLAEEPPAEEAKGEQPTEANAEEKAATPQAAERQPAPTWFWIMLAIGIAALALTYVLWSWERLEVFKMLLASFFPLALLILAVLGSIVFGLATPAEAAAVGAFGAFILTAVYRFIGNWRAGSPGARSAGTVAGRTLKDFLGIVKESSFLTARTSAMVCWLFVGSAIFSAAFALLGGQELIERWVLSLDMTPLQFMILAQFIIFILGWPLEWTEIIIIFMPIFIPLLPHFGIDPLFFGLLVALNLQTAFLSPPVAMAAFYLKGVAPPHVTLNQIFGGMLPFMGIQIIALILLYTWPEIGLWLPSVLYAR
jgi:TRAP-type mannitol/chloroaromatic compound transport system permease large subunit